MCRLITIGVLIIFLFLSSFSFAQSQTIENKNMVVGIDSILSSVDKDTWAIVTQDISAEIGENVEIPVGSIL